MKGYSLLVLPFFLLLCGLPPSSHSQPVAASAASAVPATAVPRVRPTGALLSSGQGFPFKDKVRRSASGVACTASGTGQNAALRCLVAFDEGQKAHFARLGPGTFEPVGGPVRFSSSDDELDAEAAATDGQFYYVLGSHSVKRKSCASNRASRALIRFKASWPTAAGAAVPKVEGLQQTDKLWRLISADAYLGLHADACLGDGTGGRPEQMAGRPGLNIEGLAVKGGRLYVGFRAPSEAGVVPVYSVDAGAMFTDQDATPRLLKVEVGQGLGIRDMVAGRSALLLLIGPDDREPAAGVTWRIAEWSQFESTAAAVTRARVLATLDLSKLQFPQCFKELKPEAIAILDESTTGYRVLVLSDGVCDGGAMVFDLKK